MARLTVIVWILAVLAGLAMLYNTRVHRLREITQHCDKTYKNKWRNLDCQSATFYLGCKCRPID